MSLPGGGASKLGDRYEGWWTLVRLASLLRGEATRLRLEPPGVGGTGIEFWVDEPGVRWCEQVKDDQKSWTIDRLVKEGVLPSLGVHLSSGHSIRFVTSSSAAELSRLSDRARIADSAAEYRKEVLTKAQRPQVERLATSWSVTEDDAWQYLRRIIVEFLPVEQLRRTVHTTFELILQGDPETNVNELRSWLDDLLHKTWTAPMVWNRLEAKGYERRLLVGDATTMDALAATVRRNRRRIDAALPSFGLVPQPHVDRLVELLQSDDGPEVVVVDGRAGMGKSTVAAEALRLLSNEGWHTAAVRMDAVNADVRTASAIGRVFELKGSPAVLLGGVADGSPAVLLIDQLDAVSTYSGRMSDVFEAVSELLDQKASLPSVKVVLVVRTADLTGDPRIGQVLHNPRVVKFTVAELDLDVVQAALVQIGLDAAELTSASLQLLRTPLHLMVFSRLSPEGQTSTYRTLPDLYEALTLQARRAIERQVGHLDWHSITSTLVGRMSDREELYAPRSVLASASPSEVDALMSHGILDFDGQGIRFFHETYYDFLFATAFVAESRDLHDYLVDSGQHLFRRAPTRQVLEYLAAYDRSAFREVVVRLLSGERIRRHLKDVVVAVLRQLDAVADDWLAIEPLAFRDGMRGLRLPALLSEPAWFDAADSAGRWEPMLAEPNTVDVVTNHLIFAARVRPERVHALIRPYIGTTEEWRLRLKALIEWSMRPGLADLAIELIGRGDLDEARGPIAVNSDFWSILYGLKTDDPAAAARIVGAYLGRALVRARANGSGDPFASDHIANYSSSGGASTIRDIANAAPKEFIDEVLPFVRDVAEATASRRAFGESRTIGRWRYRTTDDHGVDDAIYGGIDDALQKLAHTDPHDALARIRPHQDSDADELRFLACRTFAAAGSSNEAVDWLLSDERNFNLGSTDSVRWASRELVQVATRSCDDLHLNELTERILTYYPAWERSASARQWFGRAQYELLSAVEPSRLSRQAARRMGELERKFAGQPPIAPRRARATFDGPPIPERASQFMSDKDWIGAIQRYQGTDSENLWFGGTLTLANMIGTPASAEPERFARLAMQFGPGTPSVYFERIIEAVAGKTPPRLFTDLCMHARRIAGQEVGRSICHAARAVVQDADETLLGLLEECAGDSDPDREWARTPTNSGETYYGGDFSSAGMNSTRGAAARTLALLLFAEPAHADRYTPAIARLATDPVFAVRTQAADAVGALLNHRRDLALTIANNLFQDVPIELCGALEVSNLLTYCLLRQPERFAPQLLRALDGPDTVAERAGFTWAVAFIHGALVADVPSELASLSGPARHGAAAAFASDPEVASEQLVKLFDDPDETVRSAASYALRRINDIPQSTAETIVDAFVVSTAFADNFESLFVALHSNMARLPGSALAACERAVGLSGNQLGDIRTARAAVSTDIIDVVLRLYRQGDRPTRERCLNVVDGLADAGAYGLEEALINER